MQTVSGAVHLPGRYLPPCLHGIGEAFLLKPFLLTPFL